MRRLVAQTVAAAAAAPTVATRRRWLARQVGAVRRGDGTTGAPPPGCDCLQARPTTTTTTTTCNHPFGQLLRRSTLPSTLRPKEVRSLATAPPSRSSNSSSDPNTPPIPTNTTTLLQSSSEATTTPEDVFAHATTKSFAMEPRKILFPWRHEEEPLPRLIPGSSQAMAQGGALGPGFPFRVPPLMRIVLESMAGTRLEVPWYHQLVGGWKEELAESSAYAFSQGLAGVLSNTYSVPFSDINSSRPSKNPTTTSKEPPPHKEEEEEQQQSRNTTGRLGGEINFGYTTTTTTHSNQDDDNDNDDTEECPEVEDMLEEKLRKLYQSAHSGGTDQMQIVLQCQPVSAQLQSILWLPFLSRSLVQQEPSLRHAFRDLTNQLKAYEEELGRPLNQLDAMKVGGAFGESLAQASVQPGAAGDTHIWESTAIAQVLVHCDEVFSVTDRQTGQVIQGHSNGKVRRVAHLVRLENSMETHFPSNGSLSSTHYVGSWQITDWDDLLDGNVWYL